MVNAVFLDRDGVIIEDRADFVKSWDEVVFVPGAFEAIRKLTAAELPIVIITNQSAVGRGIVTREFVDETHRRIVQEIATRGGRISGVYVCPHHPSDGCECRKPKPGLLLRAATELGLNLASSVMVGDSRRDIEAANAAGARGIMVRTGKGVQETEAAAYGTNVTATMAVAADLDAAADYILNMVHG